MLIGIVLAIVVLVLTALGLGWPRASFPRRSSLEGIEDVEAARAYDRISRWPQFRFLRSLVVRELERYHPEGTLVDIGCGPGYLAARMARAFPNLHIVGVDVSDEMVQAAVRNLSALGLGEHVEFRQGDIAALPFPDASVDFAVSTLSLHHWSEPAQAFAEIHRVLKPNGQFLVFDLRRDARRMFYVLFRFAQTFVVPTPLRRINEPLGSVLASYTPRELDALLRTTPFRQWSTRAGPVWTFVWGRKI